MALLDYLEVDVQHSKSPFEEQERGTLFDASQTTSPRDYEWLMLWLRLMLRRLQVAVALLSAVGFWQAPLPLRRRSCCEL